MATTPEGTPYVESSDLVANYPAASLSLANRVDLVGVLPFANAAARTTAIPTPTDGQYTYLQDTNSTEFWNGTAWVAAGTAPGLVHIANVALSATSSVSVDNCFTSDYQYYRIIFDGTASVNLETRTRLRVAGVDASGSNYVVQYFFASGTGTGASRATNTYMGVGDIQSTIRGAYALDILSPALATPTNYMSLNQYSGSSAGISIYMGTHSLSTAYDGITFFTNTGNLTGTIRIYGYSNG